MALRTTSSTDLSELVHVNYDGGGLQEQSEHFGTGVTIMKFFPHKCKNENNLNLDVRILNAYPNL